MYFVMYAGGYLSRDRIKKEHGTVCLSLKSARQSRDKFEKENPPFTHTGHIIQIVKGITHVIE
jgi:hypothetical protein